MTYSPISDQDLVALTNLVLRAAPHLSMAEAEERAAQAVNYCFDAGHPDPVAKAFHKFGRLPDARRT